MGDLVKLEDYRQSNKLEEEYLQFLSHINKFMKIPTSIGEMARAFYFTLRYLEGTVNGLAILSLIKSMPQDELEEMKVMVTEYMDRLSADLKQI